MRHDAAWTDLGGGVRVRQSRIERMNSGVLRGEGHAVLVDPGVLPSEIAAFAETSRGERTLIVLTHHHWDHVLGPARIPDAVTAAHPAFAACLAGDLPHAREAIAAAFAAEGEPVEVEHANFAPTFALGDSPLAWGPWTIETVQVPGHARDAIALYVPEAGVLFAGDLLSDVEPPWLEGPPAAYRASLARLAPVARSARALVPGHGTIALGATAIAERFAADTRYLDAIDAGVQLARTRGLDLEAAIAALDALPYPGRNVHPHSTVEVHRANVRHAWGATEPRPHP